MAMASSIDAAGHASRFAEASARAEAILDMVPSDDTRVTQLQADLTLRRNMLVNALDELEERELCVTYTSTASLRTHSLATCLTQRLCPLPRVDTVGEHVTREGGPVAMLPLGP